MNRKNAMKDAIKFLEKCLLEGKETVGIQYKKKVSDPYFLIWYDNSSAFEEEEKTFHFKWNKSKEKKGTSVICWDKKNPSVNYPMFATGLCDEDGKIIASSNSKFDDFVIFDEWKIAGANDD
ncbi:MAG: hypothetical protein KAS32_16370 [Candidatus Peribacteraceae bacterium]|nr:hypothetical protein [Candidatus Peribacteraceae bacterium]